MQLLSAHSALALLIAFVVFLALVAFSVPTLLAVLVAGLAGWGLVHTVLKSFADRAERWLTTPR